MKIFGKRRAVPIPAPGSPNDAPSKCKSESPADGTTTGSKPATPKAKVPFFSGDAVPETSKAGGGVVLITEINEILLMDPKTLNAKQRRLVRRHEERKKKEREGVAVPVPVEVKGVAEKETEGEETEKKDENIAEGEESEKKDEKKEKKVAEKKEEPPITKSDVKVIAEVESESSEVKSSSDALSKLNSKDRRKLLRTLKREEPDSVSDDYSPLTNGEVISRLEDQAVLIGKQNLEKTVQKETKKRKLEGVSDVPEKKAKKEPDWSHLPPVEQERRRKQRESQQEAKEKREKESSGIQGFRHPLNSERRRANRRKPGKAGRIAAMKRVQREETKGDKRYRAGGYDIRKNV